MAKNHQGGKRTHFVLYASLTTQQIGIVLLRGQEVKPKEENNHFTVGKGG